MKFNSKHAAKAGFSLVEMLVVIAVIGIIAAIAVPNIGRINDAAKESTAKRNAQSLASVYASANAAGLDFSNGGKRATTAAITQAIINGGTVSDADSPFNGETFRVPGLTVAQRKAAEAYLDIEGGNLIYVGNK